MYIFIKNKHPETVAHSDWIFISGLLESHKTSWRAQLTHLPCSWIRTLRTFKMTTAYNVAQGKKKHRYKKWKCTMENSIKNIHQLLWLMMTAFSFSPSFWNFTSFLKIQCLRQHLLSQLSWPEGEKLQDHITFLFRFQGTFLWLIINTQNHNLSTFLKHFTALTYLFQISDQDNSNVRSRQTAQANGGWQYVDLLFRFIKWLIFEVTLFLFAVCYGVLLGIQSNWK